MEIIRLNPDGKSIWVFDRCGARECTSSKIAPLQEFDPSGKLVAAIGTGMFIFPHGIYVDQTANVWITDARGAAGKGQQVLKFSPEGKLLMTMGKAGVSGTAGAFARVPEPFRADPFRADPFRADPFRADPFRTGPFRTGPFGAATFRGTLTPVAAAIRSQTGGGGACRISAGSASRASRTTAVSRAKESTI